MSPDGGEGRQLKSQTSNKRPCICVQKGGICRVSAPLMCTCIYVPVCMVCAGVQMCRYVYVLILTYPSPGLRQDPLMIYHCICQASQSVSFQGFPLLCLPNGHWIRKMLRWCYSVHLQMALGSQTQVCLTHWAIPKSYPTFSYHLKSSNWGWKYSSKMFAHFYLKFFIPGTWDQLTRLPAWKHRCIPLSDSIQGNQSSPVRQRGVNDGWLGWAGKRKCHHVFLSTTLQWANPERRRRERQMWVFQAINTACKSFCGAIISTWNSSLQRHRLIPLESRHAHTSTHLV